MINIWATRSGENRLKWQWVSVTSDRGRTTTMHSTYAFYMNPPPFYDLGNCHKTHFNQLGISIPGTIILKSSSSYDDNEGKRTWCNIQLMALYPLMSPLAPSHSLFGKFPMISPIYIRKYSNVVFEKVTKYVFFFFFWEDFSL